MVKISDNWVYEKNGSFAFARLLFFKNSLTEIEEIFEKLIW